MLVAARSEGSVMGFEERKKKAKRFEEKAVDHFKKTHPNYTITPQKVFGSRKRPGIWGVSKDDHRDRWVAEVEYRSEAGVARESDFKKLRMYQHHGLAKKGYMIYPDSVRVPRKLRREARESGQEIVRLPEDRCFIATAAFGTSLVEEIEILREYRDRRLLVSALGRYFVVTYCKVSPPIAKLVAKINLLRRLVRVLVRCLVATYAKRCYNVQAAALHAADTLYPRIDGISLNKV